LSELAPPRQLNRSTTFVFMPAIDIGPFLVKQGIPFVAGMLVTGVLGRMVERMLRATRELFWTDDFLPSPAKEAWEKMFKMSPDTHTPVRWLGWMERFGFFLAFWSGEAVLVGGWLAFKVASKWAAWQNIVKVPESNENFSGEQLASARFRLGTHLLQRFLLGTLGNVLAALVGVAVGKLLVQLLS
jgi:hypothetical protein